MRICIVGGGKVGYYLAEHLLAQNHHPVVIEPDEATCKKLADNLDIPVIQGDGTIVETLVAAGCDECQAMACVSGKDEVNLIAAQLGKKVFHVQKTIARINNPRNTDVLKRLGVDIALSATNTIAFLIEQEVETEAIHHLLSLGDGSISIVEVQIPPQFHFNGSTLTSLYVPEGLVVVSVMRKDELIIPSGTTQVFSGDRLTVLSSPPVLHTFLEHWKLNKK